MFCKKLQPKIKGLLRKFEDKLLQQALTGALHVTNTLKAFMFHDQVLKVVELTRTEMDNQLRDAFIKAIDESVKELLAAKECSALPTMDARLQCYREHLRKATKNEALDELRKLAVAIAGKVHKAVEGKSFYNAAFELFYLLNKK